MQANFCSNKLQLDYAYQEKKRTAREHVQSRGIFVYFQTSLWRSADSHAVQARFREKLEDSYLLHERRIPN